MTSVSRMVPDLLRIALRRVWVERPDLVTDRAHERTVVAAIAGALTVVMKPFDERWRADVEYNRIWRGDAAKRKLLEQKIVDCTHGANWIRLSGRFPDLIVHDPRHGAEMPNLLVLEAMVGRRGGDKKRDSDREKIFDLMEQLDYKFGVFLEFDGTGGRPRLQWLTIDPRAVSAVEEL
ncbi:hypothetical protein ACFWM1_04240 [Nocardia sp. NPDC058379]|uniref:hypothetical protein n=1 Tax=unclassified Nocardia TaxID=2637762 RepID=UPI00365467B0